MLISLRKKFIFVANLKSASTAIEKQLRSVCEVAILQTRFGKHHGLADIERRFSWVFDYVPRDEMFIFGVIRDPVDFMISLYNFHRKEAFQGQPSYTGEMSFDAFMDDWTRRNSWQCRPQSDRFRNRKGVFDLDYLIDYARLDEQLADLGWNAIGVAFAGPLPGQIGEVFTQCETFGGQFLGIFVPEFVERKRAAIGDFLGAADCVG